MNKGIVFLLLWSVVCSGQEKSQEEGAKGNHRVTAGLSHANVAQGVKETGTGYEWLSLPAWSLDYDYWLSDRWAIGLHTDIIVESFEVKANLSSEEETIERSSPIAPAAVGIFKATKHSSFLLGAGVEFAKEENLFLNRAGYEWGTEIGSDWELGISLCYDFRWNAYDSYMIGIGVSKIFKKRNK